MKLTKKIIALFAVVALGSSAFAFDWNTIPDVQSYKDRAAKVDGGLKDFTEQLAVAIPQAATQQNVWADAYIGKLFPAIPPHLGGGFNIGLTHMDTSGLAQAAKALDIKGIKDSYFFPVFTADLRVGGVLFPFDAGLTVMKTGSIGTDLMGADMNVKLTTFGADVRYALFEGGLVFPKVSVGAAYYYNEGNFSASSKYADADIDYKVHTLALTAQASKSFLICTPFIGVRGVVSKYDNSYSWKLKSSMPALDAMLASAGISSGNSGSYKSDKFDFAELQPQIFAGVGFNLLVLQTTASVTADLRNIADKGLWSGALSLRLKL